jgi:hypothetical protein
MALLVAAIVAPATLSAQALEDFVGEWESTVETERGTFTTTYTFTLDGNELKGTISGRMGEVEIDAITYADGTITFSVTRTMRENTMTLTYTAKIMDGVLEGTVSTPRGEREFTATRVET